MKYIWIFSLLLFPQLSWSIDENITQTHYKDAFDIAIENTCKDHEEPETCETEYKKAFKTLFLHALVKTMSLKHAPIESTYKEDPILNNENPTKSLCEDHANPETCEKATKTISLNLLMKNMRVIHDFITDHLSNNPFVAIIGPYDERVIRILCEDSANPETCKAKPIADENTTQAYDDLDTAIEDTCKDHEEPETCETEYKKEFKTLFLHALGKMMMDGRPAPIESTYKEDPILKSLCEDHANPETCKIVIEGSYPGSSIMDYQPQMPERVVAENLLFCSRYYPKKLEFCLSALSVFINSPENSLQKLRDVYHQD
ncbi:MAG: hypothetical protein OXB86_02295 [Bdellovibrionales bacterium]|nr:hypothetical protein [Bdellovibrionales bacterium]